MDFSLKVMDFSLKVMDFSLKVMDFSLKEVDLSVLVLRCSVSIRNVMGMLCFKFHRDWTSNPIKKTHILNLGVGVKSDRRIWSWSGSNRNVMDMLCFKFHRDWTSGTLSRRPLSSILELESRVIDGSGVGQDPIGMSWRCYVSNFIEIGLQEPVKKTPVLHLGVGVMSDRWVWIWPGSIRNVKEILCLKFQRDWTSGTLSR